jgi:sec-independent protein translocase protein TatA
MRLEGWHLVIIIALAVLLFGAPKLPGLARSVGQSLRIFKSEVRQLKEENSTGPDTAGRSDGTPTQPSRAAEAAEGTAGGVRNGSTDGDTGTAAPGGSTPGKP